MDSATVLKVAYLALATCELGVAQTSPELGPRNFRAGGIFRTWSVSQTVFDQYLDHPNATTEALLPRQNITSPPSTSAAADQPWSWGISVRADIPAANSSALSDEDMTKFFTGTRITVNAPPDLITAINTTTKNSSSRAYGDFEVCLVMWEVSDMSSSAYPDELRQDDGSCSSIVSNQCVKDLEAAAVKLYPSYCRCPSVRDIPSCDQETVFSNNCEIGRASCRERV